MQHGKANGHQGGICSAKYFPFFSFFLSFFFVFVFLLLFVTNGFCCLLAASVWAEDSWLQEHALKSVDSEASEGGKTDGERETKKPKLEIKSNPRVFMDIEIGGRPSGRMTFQLRADIVPRTVGLDLLFGPSWSFFFFFPRSFFLTFLCSIFCRELFGPVSARQGIWLQGQHFPQDRQAICEFLLRWHW